MLFEEIIKDDYKIENINSLESLQNSINYLNIKIEEIEESIKNEKTKFPFTIENLIQDCEFIKSQKEIYSCEINKLEEILNNYLNKIKTYKKGE